MSSKHKIQLKLHKHEFRHRFKKNKLDTGKMNEGRKRRNRTLNAEHSIRNRSYSNEANHLLIGATEKSSLNRLNAAHTDGKWTVNTYIHRSHLIMMSCHSICSIAREFFDCGHNRPIR